jgi:uncharacterized repeat protein (TIGR03803 family)
VFSITPQGAEAVVYSFGKNNGNGKLPQAGLLNVGGTLYGTTYAGGKHKQGTVFSLTPGGEEKVLYSFAGTADDSAYPDAGLINVNGTLYGTTEAGGAARYGTVFAITP